MTRPEPSVSVVAPARRKFWNVPNTLTVSRLLLAVAIFALIDFQLYGAALLVFIAASLTDALDGYFARLLNQDTPIGRQLDPLIDKVIVSGCYIYLATVDGTGVMPWMVTAIVVRELLIQGLRSHLEGQGQPFGARTAGKLKTVVQCLSISLVLFCLMLPPFSSWIWYYVRDGVTYLAVALTLYSGASYLVIAFPRLTRDRLKDE
jgi:CDP-diacylglycerol---glycerol-3-phosphate 3-phosphatidyltransferase